MSLADRPDSNLHSRCLQAMVATVEAYAADEAAQRIIPAVAPLGVDPVLEVRQSALAALDAFMRLLKEHSAQLDSAATATGSAAGAVAQVTLPRLAPCLGQSVVCWESRRRWPCAKVKECNCYV